MQYKTVTYQPPKGYLHRDDLRAELLAQLLDVLNYLLPQGKRHGRQYIAGDVQGNAGNSLVVELEGARAGLWQDFATQQGGDIFDLWAQAMRLDVRNNFPKVMQSIADYLGFNSVCPAVSPKERAEYQQTQQAETLDREKSAKQSNRLGKPSHEWYYYDTNGDLITMVKRYDFPDGTKSYRPWDPYRESFAAPEIRPLYNLPNFTDTDTIILVEGEKCADALNDAGLVATTAMNGANAPVNKTDWSPLKGKHVIIWPDNDEPGIKYAKRAAQAVFDVGATSVSMLTIPADKPPKWDAADAVVEGLPIEKLINDAKQPWQAITDFKSENNPRKERSVYLHKVCHYLDDLTPIPADIVSPRILTPRGFVLLGGEAKVGKSDFILSWMAHMAAGKSFLGMDTLKPLRICYLQAEVEYPYIGERLKALRLDQDSLQLTRNNLMITPKFDIILDDAGIQEFYDVIMEKTEGAVDVLVVDPLRNVFYSGDRKGGENDNEAMLHFLNQRLLRLRNKINPDAAIVLVHHIRKLNKKQFEEAPFQSFSGASSLRGAYTSGMLLYRPDESHNERVLMFELRNGERLPNKRIDKIDGRWQELGYNEHRVVRQDASRKFDQERDRQADVILQLISDEAKQGRVYTANQFAEHFEGKSGLGSSRTINERLSVQATKGYIKYFRNATDYGLAPAARSKQGYLCVEGMVIPSKESTNVETGEISQTLIPLRPTHYKSQQTGAFLPVENPKVWVTQEGMGDA